MEEKIVTIINDMSEVLNAAQLRKLQEVLLQRLSENEAMEKPASNSEYLEMFLNAKKIEGCSDRTIKYYRDTIARMIEKVDSPIRKITTEDMRAYLSDYQNMNC